MFSVRQPKQMALQSSQHSRPLLARRRSQAIAARIEIQNACCWKKKSASDGVVGAVVRSTLNNVAAAAGATNQGPITPSTAVGLFVCHMLAANAVCACKNTLPFCNQESGGSREHRPQKSTKLLLILDRPGARRAAGTTRGLVNQTGLLVFHEKGNGEKDVSPTLMSAILDANCLR